MRKNKFFRFLGTIIIVLLILGGGLVAYVKTALPNVGPPPVLSVKSTPEIIKRGAYLTNHVAVCIDCHSTRDFSLFSGPVKPGTEGAGGEMFDHLRGFPGTIISKNITPYKMASWTDGEIFRAITAGVNQKGEALFPIMPYPDYAQMPDEDVYAIIAYLRTLPAVQQDIPATKLDFPVSLLVNTMPAKRLPVRTVNKKDTVAYGHYLTTVAVCTECHTRKEKGSPVGDAFAGGTEFVQESGAIVRAANITPDKATGIGNWTVDYFIQRFKSYADNNAAHRVVAKGEFNSEMPWTKYAGMDTTDLRAIYAYLRTVKAATHPVDRFTPPSMH